VGSLISKKTMTLCLPGYNTDASPTHIGISQGSPLSLIFFLFDYANIVDGWNQHTSPSSGIGYIDDVNSLAFGKTIEENCRTLQTVHELCLEWA
jgi:hypothetical protein